MVPLDPDYMPTHAPPERRVQDGPIVAATIMDMTSILVRQVKEVILGFSVTHDAPMQEKLQKKDTYRIFEEPVTDAQVRMALLYRDQRAC